MRKTIAAIAALLALLFAPVLWGLPPPGDQVPAELAWGWVAEHDSMTIEASVANGQMLVESTLEAVATETLATTPPTGGVRLVTLTRGLGPGDAFSHNLPGRTRGSTWCPAGCARRYH